MKVLQITDLHIGREGEDTGGVDVRKNFLSLLDIISHQDIDHVVVTGDLCYDNGEEEIYDWIKTKLNQLNIPVNYIAGNHDDSILMGNCLGISDQLIENEIYYHKRLCNQDCLFLDSGKGTLSDKQYEWLGKQLQTINKDVVIFIHHPPMKCGVPFMDNKYALQDIERLQEVLFAYPHAISIYCGHYHVDKVIRYKNITLHITPSTYFQIDQSVEDFKIDHHHIGFRIIDFADEKLTSEVQYFVGHKLKVESI